MRTVFIKIGSRLEAQGYPVRVWNQGSPVPVNPNDYLAATLAQCLPRTNSDPAPTLASVRAFVLATADPDDRFQEYGDLLYNVLLSCPPLRDWLAARQQGQDLRTFLAVEDSDLFVLPWELLLDANRDPTFLDSNIPIAWGEPGEAEGPVLKWPIRLLIAVGEGPGEKIMAQEEADAIERRLHPYHGLVEARVVPQPMREELLEEFRQYRPHIFHFIGHAVMVDGQPSLLFKGTKGKLNWTINLNNIRDFTQDWRPRVVVLNACRSGMASQDQVRSLAGAFLRRKVPAVIGMQADIRGDAAAALGGQFYVGLAEGKTIDAALAAARDEVGKKTGFNRRDWCLPRLTLAALPEQVLRMVFPIGDSERDAIKHIVEFSNLCYFIDRQRPRQLVSGTAGPGEPDEWRRPLLVLEGPSQVGKSWLLYWCLRSWILWRWTIAYVSMRDDEAARSEPPLDFLQTLRLLRDGYSQAAGDLRRHNHPRAMSREAFNPFNHLLNHLSELIAGRVIPQMPAQPAGTVLEETNARANPPWPDESLGRAPDVLAAFRVALAAAASQGPVVLALDHLNINPSHFQAQLLPHLIGRIAQGGVRGVYMVLVLSNEDPGDRVYRAALVKELGAAFQPVEVPPFPPGQFMRLAREFILLRGKELDERLTAILTSVSEWPEYQKEWMPSSLEFLAKLLKL